MIDRKKVIKGLEYHLKELSVGKTCFECPYCGNNPCEIHLITDAIALLKEQEGVVPYIDIDEAKCPVCKVKLTRQELIGDDVLFEDFFDYCPHCGKPVLWEGR